LQEANPIGRWIRLPAPNMQYLSRDRARPEKATLVGPVRSRESHGAFRRLWSKNVRRSRGCYVAFFLARASATMKSPIRMMISGITSSFIP
jgi:hypothetical protein